jgi:hypothetical protein
MTPEERQLIAGLFDRMRGFGTPEKDREAEALINQSVRAMPDAPYMLVQSVLVQEQALQAANDRVMELEERLRDHEGGERPSRGFLGGGLFGNSRSETRTSSVPQIGSRSAPAAYENRSPWTQGAAQPGPAQQPAPSASGGFMKSALATAAGVAGGMLLADSIRNMMGSAHANPAASSTGSQEGGGQQYVDERHNDPGNSPEAGTYDAGSNDPGFDSGDFGGDLDI